MEETDLDSTANVCIDQIERIMQELDSTTTGPDNYSQPTTPPTIELPHRPMVLPAGIKEETVENVEESARATITVQPPTITTKAPVEGTTNNIEVQTTIPAQMVSNVTSIENAVHTPQILIKQERIEADIIAPSQIVYKDSDKNATNSAPESNTEEQILTHTLITRINMPAPTPSKDVNQEYENNNQSTSTLSATIPMSSPCLENAEQELDETLPDNFFDDLIRDADNITAAALQANAPVTTSVEKQTNPVVLNIKSEPSDICGVGDIQVVVSNVKSEPLGAEAVPEAVPSAPIPENFFDDLLVDRAAEHIEDVVNHDLEIKYSERLKELQQLESAEQRSSKAHKKHKKKKKKSHKRSRDDVIEDGELIDDNQKRSKHSSNSHSPTISSHTTVKNEMSLSPAQMEIINLDSDEPETSTSAANRASMQKRMPSIRIKSELATFQRAVDDPSDICLPLKENELFQRRSNFNRNGLIKNMTSPLGFKRIKLEKDVDETAAKPTDFISPKDKMENAKQRAIAAIDELNKMSKKDKTTLSAFIHTTTVRKLPNSHSYIHQQVYDNRSPLHNVNNVQYKFNSHVSRFNLNEWGLEQMPSQAAKVAKVLGFDVHTLMKKMQTVKMPPKLLKIKKDHMELKEQMREPQSSFLLTVATQTDEVTVLDATSKRQKSGFNIGVQATPLANNIATQTIDLPAAGNNSYQDLPLVRKLGSLNENQLWALSEFVDLMREPPLPKDASSIDLYRQHQRIIDLYKWSQRPSALEQTTQESQQISTPSICSNTQILRDPRQERMVLTVQAPMRSSFPNPRDPRQERKKQVPRSPPPPPPTRHLHVVHPSQPHYPSYSNSHLPQAKTNSDSVPQKMPVISRVIHPASLPPQPPRDVRKEHKGKNFGRGSIRQ